MAYTKIHAIKTTLDKSIAYICNEAKTDKSVLIDSFGCAPETAKYDFNFALSHTNKNDPNLAFHLIQSFLPGEVGYDEAHQIGLELADRLLQNNYSFVLSTHIDKGHIHNHLIFCAADNVYHKKYHDCKKTYGHIRHLSDDLCREHNLSVIKPGQGHSVPYNKWLSLIDTDTDKMKSQPGLQKWAKKENLINMASAYANAGSLSALKEQIEHAKAESNVTRKDLVRLEKDLKSRAEIIHYAKMYYASIKVYGEYKRSKDPERFYINHADEINLFEAASHALKSVYRINIKEFDFKAFVNQYNTDAKHRQELSRAYDSSKKELYKLEAQYADLQKYTGINQESETPTQKKSKRKDQAL